MQQLKPLMKFYNVIANITQFCLLLLYLLSDSSEKSNSYFPKALCIDRLL